MVEDAVVAPQMPAIHNSPTLCLGPLLDRALKGIKEKTEANASNDLRMLMKTPPHEARPGNCSNSILSFSNEHMTDSIESIGISMGDDIKNVQPSVLLIKNVEKDRL
jgi:hypothetical protein